MRLAALLLMVCGVANAAVIAVAIEGKNRIDLHDEQGPCIAQAKLAVWSDGTQRIPGCWIVSGPMVSIVFLDGDTAQIPVRLFRKPNEI